MPNALAEHTAGSVQNFAVLMNAKAKELGCQESHFNNPSGLNDPQHYTSAYDMALIAQAAFQNETFVTIDSSLYYDLPPTRHNPDGFRVYPGHRMLKKNAPQYYPGVIGGKTGYTMLAGNTLVTCAEKNGMKLITVILNGHQTHYSDTKALLDFGFSNFQSVNIAEADGTYSSDISDAQSAISYELPESAPPAAVARITYQYNDRQIGASYLLHKVAGEDSDAAVSAQAENVEVAAASDEMSGEGPDCFHRIWRFCTGFRCGVWLRCSSVRRVGWRIFFQSGSFGPGSDGSADIFGKRGKENTFQCPQARDSFKHPAGVLDHCRCRGGSGYHRFWASYGEIPH